MNKKCLVFSLLLFATILSYGQDMKTMVYLKYDSTDLSLDLFLPDDKTIKDFPLVIYVHGGGFSGGNRGGGRKLGNYLATKGMATASISYTLSRKGKGFGCENAQQEKIYTMQLAASETWEATAFLLTQLSELGFDPNKVFLAGSSAGAEAILHAAYLDREKFGLHEHSLASDFKYAGLISGAGAIIDLSFITPEKAIPTMFFHGDSDPLVPYNIASHHFCSPEDPGWMMMFGSLAISKHLEKLEVPYQLYSFTGGGHGHAGEYFYQDQGKVEMFIRQVLSGNRFYNHLIQISTKP